MTTRAGTPYYISPEVIKGDYSLACDIWSLGVILYILIAGYPPFYGDHDKEILRKVQICEYDFEGEEWEQITPMCKDLITKMLVINVHERLDIDGVLGHSWMTVNREEIPDIPLNIAALRDFAGASALKKSVLMVIASQCSEIDIEALKQKFNEIDVDHDGTITLNELRAAMSETGMEMTQIQKLWEGMDVDKNGSISYSEFLASTLDKSLYLQRERLWQAFRVFDKDNSGKISPDELKEVLKGYENTINPSVWNQLVQQVDENNDGEIDFTEFCTMMESMQNAVNS